MQNSTYDPLSVNEFEKTKIAFHGQKATGICAAGGTVNIDYLLTDDHLLTGAILNLVNHDPSDEIKYQIIHPTYGVVNQFIDWYAANFDKDLTYPAKLPAGLIIRIVYVSHGSQDVQIYANHIMHKILI